MGLIRKTLAVGTVGAVRGSSKKQRTAKAQLKEIRKQTDMMRQAAAGADSKVEAQVEARGQAALVKSRELQRLAKEKAAAEAQIEPVKKLPPEGWYPDSEREHLLRWWDGQDWTDRTAPRI